MTHEALYNGFMEFVNNGDEVGAKAFLLDHLNEFPEEIKKQIAFEFFVDAVKKEDEIDIIKEKAADFLEIK